MTLAMAAGQNIFDTITITTIRTIKQSFKYLYNIFKNFATNNLADSKNIGLLLPLSCLDTHIVEGMARVVVQPLGDAKGHHGHLFLSRAWAQLQLLTQEGIF